MRDWAERHALAIVLVLAVGGLASAALVGAIAGVEAGDISAYGLLAVAVVAVVLALWRSLSTQRQAAASGQQAETARREALDSRLQRGTEMLVSEHPSVRLGGLHLLNALATEHPADYAQLVDAMIAAAEEERATNDQ